VTVKVLEDGTRLYSNGTKYTPVPAEQRKKLRRKPTDPSAVRWAGEWLLPLDLLEEDQRQLPETRPDSLAYDHMARAYKCRCPVCKRPEARRWKRLYRRQMRKDSSASA
jgi:hypothetical protein